MPLLKSVYNWYQSISQALFVLIKFIFSWQICHFLPKTVYSSLFQAAATASTCVCVCECERDRTRGSGTYLPCHPLPLLRFSTSGSAQSSLLLPLKEKVKVAQLCPTLCDLMDSIVHGVFQASILEFLSSGDLPNPGIEPGSPTFQEDSLLNEPQGKPKNTGVGCLFLLQWIFLPRNWTGVSCIAGRSLPAQLPAKPIHFCISYQSLRYLYFMFSSQFPIPLYTSVPLTLQVHLKNIYFILFIYFIYYYYF